MSRGTGHKKFGIIRQRTDPKKSKKILENLLTNSEVYGIIQIQSREKQSGGHRKKSKKSLKKLLTRPQTYGIISTEIKGCDLPQERN
jgi:hypothetical protein